MKMTWPEIIERQGFALIPSVFTEAEMDRILDQIDQISPRRSRAGVRHTMAISPVADLARALLGLACGVLGPSAFPFRATLFDKSPRSNWLVVWHQDTALPLQQSHKAQGWGPWSVKEGVAYAHAPSTALSEILALRVHLDDSTALNGPLRVLPGTHTAGVLTDDDIHELSTRIPSVDCLSVKGGVLAMRPLLVHSSSKSQNQQPRRVLHIEYAASPTAAKPFDLVVA
jgi:Phytanoyl-CoA dioxygenase (PhyH)